MKSYSGNAGKRVKMTVEIPEEIEEEVKAKGGFERIVSSISNKDIKKLEQIMKTLADEKD